MDGNRVAAIEILINTPYISKLIRDGSFHEIKEIMEKGSEAGMVTFDQSLYELFKAGKIDLKTALANADSSTNLEWKINFGGGVKGLQSNMEKSEPLHIPDNSG